MPPAKNKLQFLFFLFVIFCFKINAQPFIDIISYNNQIFFSEYKDSSHNPVFIQDHFLNLFIPVKFGKGNVILFRINSEKLELNRTAKLNSSSQLFSISAPVGLQLVSKNQKWKCTGIFITKINSDFKDDLSKDLQFGGIGLVTKVINENLQVRLGLYYNKEFFGDFFMPLGGIDWKINNKWQMYGTLPSNFRIEYNIYKSWNTGLGFRSFLRSFRLNNIYSNDFIWIRENQLKIYFEGAIYKNLFITVDVFRSIAYRMPRNDFKSVRSNQIEKSGIPVFAPFKDNFGFTIGFAIRVMTKKQEKEKSAE